MFCLLVYLLLQAYQNHLDGTRHKKRVAAASEEKEEGGRVVAKGSYLCQLCDIICTGELAFSAHIRGAKHLKVWILLDLCCSP